MEPPGGAVMDEHRARLSQPAQPISRRNGGSALRIALP
jgi:hypothetical protein